MNYLERLKREAQARQEQELKIQQQLEQQRQRFQLEVKPSFEQLLAYLRELSQQLNYLKPNNLVNYKVQGVGNLQNLQQQNYRIATYKELRALKERAYTIYSQDSPEVASNFCLRCECVGQYPIRIEKRKPLEINLQKEYLLQHGIRFTGDEHKDNQHNIIKVRFIIEPIIPIEFEFSGDLETNSIDLKITNFNELGEKVYNLSPQEVNHSFLDELAKYITRQPNHLALRDKQQLKITPLSAQQKDSLEFEVWLQNMQREYGESLSTAAMKPVQDKPKDFEEFNEWLRLQEAQLHSSPAKASSQTNKKFYHLFKQINPFKKAKL
jgi:hypothetical protein